MLCHQLRHMDWEIDMRYFNVSYNRQEQPVRARHGASWEPEDYELLKRLFFAGASLQTMCEDLQRSSGAILPRLANMSLLALDGNYRYYYRIDPDTHARSTQPTQEPIMAKAIPEIETKTLIGGEDAALLSDKQIFGRIAELEAQVAAYGRIGKKPAKLTKLIGQIIDDIVALGAYVDAREDA